MRAILYSTSGTPFLSLSCSSHVMFCYNSQILHGCSAVVLIAGKKELGVIRKKVYKEVMKVAVDKT